MSPKLFAHPWTHLHVDCPEDFLRSKHYYVLVVTLYLQERHVPVRRSTSCLFVFPDIEGKAFASPAKPVYFLVYNLMLLQEQTGLWTDLGPHFMGMVGCRSGGRVVRPLRTTMATSHTHHTIWTFQDQRIGKTLRYLSSYCMYETNMTKLHVLVQNVMRADSTPFPAPKLSLPPRPYRIL